MTQFLKISGGLLRDLFAFDGMYERKVVYVRNRLPR